MTHRAPEPGSEVCVSRGARFKSVAAHHVAFAVESGRSGLRWNKPSTASRIERACPSHWRRRAGGVIHEQAAQAGHAIRVKSQSRRNLIWRWKWSVAAARLASSAHIEGHADQSQSVGVKQDMDRGAQRRATANTCGGAAVDGNDGAMACTDRDRWRPAAIAGPAV